MCIPYCFAGWYPCALADSEYSPHYTYHIAVGFTYGVSEKLNRFISLKRDGSKTYAIEKHMNDRSQDTILHVIEADTVTKEPSRRDVQMYLKVTPGLLLLLPYGLYLTSPGRFPWIHRSKNIADVTKCEDYVYLLTYDKGEVITFDEKTMSLIDNITLDRYSNGHTEDRIIKFMDRFYISSYAGHKLWIFHGKTGQLLAEHGQKGKVILYQTYFTGTQMGTIGSISVHLSYITVIM